jgi:hypothetical protein
MSTSSPPARMPDVPMQIFDKFITNLLEAGVSPEVVDQLRTTLIQDKKYTERALREAVLGPEAQE